MGLCICIPHYTSWRLLLAQDQINKVVRSPIKVGSHPLGIAYDLANGNLYVTNPDDNTVSLSPISPIVAGDLFVEDLRKSYDQMFEIKDALETKANNIMTISGAVATLTFGFGSLFLKNLHPNYEFLPMFLGFLFAGIITSIIAIGFCTQSFRLSFYIVRFVRPIDSKNTKKRSVFDDEFNPLTVGYKNELIEGIKGQSKEQFIYQMAEDYILAINENNKQNLSKTRSISRAQFWFLISMVIIAILLGIVIHALVKAIAFPFKT